MPRGNYFIFFRNMCCKNLIFVNPKIIPLQHKLNSFLTIFFVFFVIMLVMTRVNLSNSNIIVIVIFKNRTNSNKNSFIFFLNNSDGNNNKILELLFTSGWNCFDSTLWARSFVRELFLYSGMSMAVAFAGVL